MNLDIFGSRRRIWLSRAVAIGFIASLFIGQNIWSLRAPVFGEFLSLVGVIFIAIAVIGRVWSGSFICGYKNATLVTSGPYSACRNPLYFFSLIGSIGIGLCTQTLSVPAVFIFIFWIYYVPVIKQEENKLRGIHGALFDQYCARTPRFFPSFKNYDMPAEYTVTSKYFESCLKEVIWFVIAAGIIDFLEELHTLQYLPSYFYIY